MPPILPGTSCPVSIGEKDLLPIRQNNRSLRASLGTLAGFGLVEEKPPLPDKPVKQVAARGGWAQFLTASGKHMYKNAMTGEWQTACPPCFEMERPKAKGTANVCKKFLANTCHYGKSCGERHVEELGERQYWLTFFAQTICHAGTKCKRSDCLFSHPHAPMGMGSLVPYHQ